MKIKKEQINELVWPIVTIGFFHEYDDFHHDNIASNGNEDFNDIITEAKNYLETYGLKFDIYKDVVSTDIDAQTIELAQAITWEQAKKLINDAEWMSNETVYLSDIVTEIMFQDRENHTISIDMLESKIRENNNETFKCPECGSKVLVATGYCLKCKKKVKPKGKKEEKDFIIEKNDGFSVLIENDEENKKEKMKKNIFEIKENIRVSKDTILEKGDRIQLKEFTRVDQMYELEELFGGNWEEVATNIVQAMSDHDFNEIYNYIIRMWT